METTLAPAAASAVHPPRRATPVRALTPARPAAVLVPALAWGAATALAVLAVTAPASLTAAGVARVLVLALAADGAAFVARLVLERRGNRFAVAVPSALGAAVAAFAVDAVLPGAALGPRAAWAAAVVAGLGLPVVSAWRRDWLRWRPRRVSLLAGSAAEAEAAVERLEAIPGLRVASVLLPAVEGPAAARVAGRPAVPTPNGRIRLEREVIVSSPRRRPEVATALAQCVALGHHITSESAALRHAEGRVDSRHADPLSLLMGRRPSVAEELLSRAFDVLVAGSMLLALSPVLLAVAVAVLLDSGRPVLFVQERIGRRGRPFPILKFRTMRRDAEARSGPVFASQRDPRITRIGRWLRLSHLDELPQLFNVLAGHMSIVGPRPERRHFMERLRGDVPLFDLRTYVRPGITGWAQVRLPYAADSEDARAKLEYDLYYVTRRSFAFDLAILLETVDVALRGRGAR